MSASKLMYLRNTESGSLPYLHAIYNLQHSAIVSLNFKTFKTVYPGVDKYGLIFSNIQVKLFPNLGKIWGLCALYEALRINRGGNILKYSWQNIPSSTGLYQEAF